mmetsp:Transcript_12970/g.28637  ORF Transcript_12970/g.28637 Transcript_12970/m.28637 type:complete len:80 (-) Transcript_12970:127-366(-)
MRAATIIVQPCPSALFVIEVVIDYAVAVIAVNSYRTAASALSSALCDQTDGRYNKKNKIDGEPNVGLYVVGGVGDGTYR